MALVLRMRTVSRFLVFMASIVLWLVLLTVLNRMLLNMDDLAVVLGALAFGAVQAVATVYVLRI